MSLSICIFAYNEATLLPRCIAALDAAAAGSAYRAHIVVNGSKDDTGSIAQTFSSADERIQAHLLPVADKANAWNDYVYRIAGDEDTHIFLDGDIQPSAGAFKALAESLQQSPCAYGAAALPAAGRSQQQWAKTLLVNHYFSGNLYAFSGNALMEFRKRKIRLPFGAKGEDGLLTYLLLTDLKGGPDDSHKHRVAIAEDATFEFDSLRPRRSDVMLYHRRLIRYSERHAQKQILYALLKKHGISALPDVIYDIYTEENLKTVKPRTDPINFIYDLITIKKLKSRFLRKQRAQA